MNATISRAVLVIFCALTAALSGCNKGNSGTNSGSGQKTQRIVILTNGTSPFWDAAKAGARDAAKDLKVEAAGLRVVVDTNDFSVQGQIDKLKQYAGATDIVAVGISVTDSNNSSIADEMKKLQDQGIKVVAIDSDVDRKTARDSRFAYLGTDNIVGGQELGKAAKGLRPEGGKYTSFVGLKGAANAKERNSGFAQGAGDKFEQLEFMGDGGDPEVARKNTRDALDRHDDLNVMVGIWSYNTPAIVDTVNQLEIRDKFTIVGFDAEPVAITHMAGGDVDAMVVQNPYRMGYEGVRLLKALVEDDQETIKKMREELVVGDEPDVLDTGLKVVVPDEGSPLKKEMFDERTEFMTLSEFKDWLKTKGLTGS